MHDIDTYILKYINIINNTNPVKSPYYLIILRKHPHVVSWAYPIFETGIIA